MSSDASKCVTANDSSLTGDEVAALAAYQRAVDSDAGHEKSVINLARLEPTVPSGASELLPVPDLAEVVEPREARPIDEAVEAVEAATVATGVNQPF